VGVLTTVDEKPPLSSNDLYSQSVLDWLRDEVTICRSKVAGLMARLRDGQMTTRFGPVVVGKAPSEPAQTLANRAVTKFCAVPILYD
jgi:hypothetical protein